MYPSVSCGLWLIVLFQCWCIDFHKRATQMQEFDVTEAVGWKGCVDTRYFPLSFALNLNLSYKTKVKTALKEPDGMKWY